MAGTPKKQPFSTVFDHPQLHERDATEAHMWPNVYLADALPREPMRIVRGQREQTVAWPKHGSALAGEVTHRDHMETFSLRHRTLQSREIYYRSRDHPNAHELTNHIRHPSAAPGLRSPGGVAHAVLDSTGVTYRHQGKFAQDILNGYDVQDRFFVVKLVYHTRSNRLTILQEINQQ